MKIILYTIDLFKGREHLMPWRTILEVAQEMINNGHNASILNACYNSKDVCDYKQNEVTIYSVIKNDNLILEKCKSLKPEALFIPFTFRDGLKPAKWIADIHCKKIGYMTGGLYDLHSGYMLQKLGGLQLAKPYLMEAITPKYVFSKTMKKLGISHIIGFTNLTTQAVRKSGFLNTSTIYPGKDLFHKIAADYSIINKYNLNNKKWFLFSGAPAPTRGAEILIQAVDKVKNNNIRLVMLMRTDVGSSYENIKKALVAMKHPERIHIINEKVTREQLKAFFNCAYYALLPFIVIPSEIPLTYFELLSCSTPIITFKNGGTTDYLQEGLIIANKSIKGLAITLDKTWDNEKLRAQLSTKALQKMENHPYWKEVAIQWINLLKKQ